MYDTILISENFIKFFIFEEFFGAYLSDTVGKKWKYLLVYTDQSQSGMLRM
jgi:hypothetical protein